MFEGTSEGKGGGDSEGGQSERGVEEGCLVDREKEGGKEKERGGGETSLVCTIFIQTDRGCVCPGLHFPLLLALSQPCSLSFSLLCLAPSLSLSRQSAVYSSRKETLDSHWRGLKKERDCDK